MISTNLEKSQIQIVKLCIDNFTLKNINIEKYFNILSLIIKKICTIPYLHLNTTHMICLLNDDNFIETYNECFKNIDKLIIYLLTGK